VISLRRKRHTKRTQTLFEAWRIRQIHREGTSNTTPYIPSYIPLPLMRRPLLFLVKIFLNYLNS
jgi:hypothetical protein